MFSPKCWLQFTKLHGGTFQRTVTCGIILLQKSSPKVTTLHYMKLINFLPSQAMWSVTDRKIKTQCGLQTCGFLTRNQFETRSITIYLHTPAEENYIHSQYLFAYITMWSLQRGPSSITHEATNDYVTTTHLNIALHLLSYPHDSDVGSKSPVFFTKMSPDIPHTLYHIITTQQHNIHWTKPRKLAGLCCVLYTGR